MTLVPRAQVDVAVATETAASLIADVRASGETALLAQAERLDGVRPTAIRVRSGRHRRRGRRPSTPRCAPPSTRRSAGSDWPARRRSRRPR